MMFKELFTEAKMTDDTFVDAMVDLVDEAGIDYNNTKTKDIIGDLVTYIRKNKKSLYNYWSKNRSEELMVKLEKAFI